MGYDIHAHAPDQDVSLVLPGLSLNLQQHGAVFASPSVDYSKYPLATRMVDFFGDAAFSPDEIQPLVTECENLQAEFRGLQQEKCVKRLLEVCRKAAGLAYAVTCHCD